MKTILILFGWFCVSSASAATFEGKVEDWKGKPKEAFSDPESNFKLVFKKLRDGYVDRDVTEEDLYRAATAGMLAALNSGKENESWNALLSPSMLEDFMIEKTGKLNGIGATLEFEEKTGYARVLMVIPNSAALKAGMKKDDVVLSVNGAKYKGKGLREMVREIRGPAGETVHLKVLRDDRVLSLNITRDKVILPTFGAKMVNSSTALLSIGFFSNETSSMVEEKLREFDRKSITKLILDLRGNGGGTFDDAVKVSEIFAPRNSTVVQTRSRDGQIREYKSNRDPWRPEVRIVVLTNKDTGSGAELLTASLKEERQAMTIGMTTQGKWNVQSVETLPNKFAVKYSILKFESPSGQSYQGTGMKPDIEIDGPKGTDLGNLQNESDLAKRISQDPPLKAAIELGIGNS